MLQQFRIIPNLLTIYIGQVQLKVYSNYNERKVFLLIQNSVKNPNIDVEKLFQICDLFQLNENIYLEIRKQR